MRPFAGNREADVAPGENEFDTHVLESEGMSSNPMTTATEFVTCNLQNVSLTFLFDKR